MEAKLKDQFVPYELALKLKELGFDEKCFGWFNYNQEIQYAPSVVKIDLHNDYTLAPLWQQAFEFFRTKHNMLSNVYSNASGYLYEIHDNIGGTHRVDSGFVGPNDSGCWNTFQEARKALLEKCIEKIQESIKF